MLGISALFALSLFRSSPAHTEGSVRAIEWTVQGVAHRLRARPERDWALLDRPQAHLRSAVGPMLCLVETADGRRQMQVELQGSYAFDLLSWVDGSGQAGAVVRQLVEGSRCNLAGDCFDPGDALSPRPHCPSAEAVARWDGGFAELAHLLAITECLPERAIHLQPEAFWVDAWDGEAVTLAVATERCDGEAPECVPTFAWLRIVPPPAWRDWLQEAAHGRGYLAQWSRRVR